VKAERHKEREKRKGETKVSVSWHGSMVKHSKSQGGKGAVINGREKLRICIQRVKKVSVVFCTRTLLYMSSLGEFIYISRYLG